MTGQLDKQAMSERQLLLKILIIPKRGNSTGIRIFDNGRYEFLSDKDLAISESGRIIPVHHEHEWRYVWQFSEPEMTHLKTLIRETKFEQFGDQTGEAIIDGKRYAWEVHLDGQSVISEQPGSYPLPEMEEFFQKFNQVRDLPEQSSVWQVWFKDHYEERLVVGLVNSVVALRPLVKALLLQYATVEQGDSLSRHAGLADDHLVAHVIWQEKEQVIEEHHLWANGRYTVDQNEERHKKPPFSKAQVEYVLASIEAIDWEAVPNPVGMA
jgi:hypothetical protein